MNIFQKRGITIIIAFIISIGVIVASFVFVNRYQAVKVAKQLDLAISERDLPKIERIIQEHPESVNTLPTMYPWWLHLITEQPEVLYPLQHACWCGEYDIAKLLIEHGADVNLAWHGVQGSQPPLRLAVLSIGEPEEEIIKLLIEHGADKSAGDDDGRTAYDYAVSLGYSELAELLKP